jgi:hypothetical protein
MPADALYALDAVPCHVCDMPYAREGMRSHCSSSHPTSEVRVPTAVPIMAATPAVVHVIAAVPGSAPVHEWAWLADLTLDDMLNSVSSSREMVPAKMRQTLANCLSKCRIAQSASDTRTQELGHKLSWLLGTAVLSGSSVTGVSGNKALAARMSRFLAGDWKALWAERIVPEEVTRQPDQADIDERKVTRAILLYHEGRVSEAMRCLSCAPRAPANMETLLALVALHPLGEAVSVEEMPEGIELDPRVFSRAVSSAPPHRSPGLDGIRYEHIKVELKLGDSEALLAVGTGMLAGKLPPFARSMHSACCLLANVKSKGGVRPLAPATTLRRLGVRQSWL